MPSLATYELKVAGTLRGPVNANQAAIQAFQNVFPKERPLTGGSFLVGLGTPIDQPYDTMVWYSGGDELTSPDGPNTRLTFQAILGKVRDGTLSANRFAMMPEVTWFYNYCTPPPGMPWYAGLRAAMKDLNEVTLPKLGQLLMPVDIRDWKWYCGDGGGD